MAQITERMVVLGSENALYGFEGAEARSKGHKEREADRHTGV